MQAVKSINKERAIRRAESTPPIASAQGKRPEARQWTCINKLHWRSVSKGARAYRAPSVAGIAWSEVIRRTTRDASSHEVLDDIHPVRDSIGEAAACTRFGGSRDIQTDIYIDSDDHIDYDDTYADQTQHWSGQSMVGDALLSSVAGSRATEAAAPSASGRQIIDTPTEEPSS